MSVHPPNCTCMDCVDLRLASTGCGTSPSKTSIISNGGAFCSTFNPPLKRLRSSRRIHDATNMRGWSSDLKTSFHKLTFLDKQLFAECFERSLMVALVKQDISAITSMQKKRSEDFKRFRTCTRSKVNSLDACANDLMSAHASVLMAIGSDADVTIASDLLISTTSGLRVALNVEDLALKRSDAVAKELVRAKTRLVQVNNQLNIVLSGKVVSLEIEFDRVAALPYKVVAFVATSMFKKLKASHPQMWISPPAPINLDKEKSNPASTATLDSTIDHSPSTSIGPSVLTNDVAQPLVNSIASGSTVASSVTTASSMTASPCKTLFKHGGTDIINVPSVSASHSCPPAIVVGTIVTGSSMHHSNDDKHASTMSDDGDDEFEDALNSIELPVEALDNEA